MIGEKEIVRNGDAQRLYPPGLERVPSNGAAFVKKNLKRTADEVQIAGEDRMKREFRISGSWIGATGVWLDK